MTDLPRNDAGKSRAAVVERVEADRPSTLDDSESSGQSTTCTLPGGIVAWYKAEDNADEPSEGTTGRRTRSRMVPAWSAERFSLTAKATCAYPTPRVLTRPRSRLRHGSRGRWHRACTATSWPRAFMTTRPHPTASIPGATALEHFRDPNDP